MSKVINKGTGFTQISNQILESANLTFKAKGLYAYMASRPHDWKFYESQLSKVSKEGRDAVNAAMKELLDCGWILKHEDEDRLDGKFNGYIYTIVHRVGLTAAVEPLRVNRCGKPATNNTISNNTDRIIRTDTPLTPQGEAVADDGFETFWQNWPAGGRKAARQQCHAKWKAYIKSGCNPFDMLNGLRRWLVSEDWQKENGKYIPAPMTWLNQSRWEAKPKLSATAMIDLTVTDEEINF